MINELSASWKRSSPPLHSPKNHFVAFFLGSEGWERTPLFRRLLFAAGVCGAAERDGGGVSCICIFFLVAFVSRDAWGPSFSFFMVG